MGTPVRSIEEEETLSTLEALWAVDHGLQTVSRAMQARLGVTGPQRFSLRLVGRAPGLTAGALARLLHHHPSTLTAMVKRLVGLGLLLREGDPEDLRRVRLRLTEAGEGIDAIREGTAEAALRVALGRMPEEDAAAFRRALGILAEELERIANDGQ